MSAVEINANLADYHVPLPTLAEVMEDVIMDDDEVILSENDKNEVESDSAWLVSSSPPLRPSLSRASISRTWRTPDMIENRAPTPSPLTPRPWSPYLANHPSPSLMMNRVKQAKETGKNIDQVVHELQDEFYPLDPQPGHVSPPSNLYRVAVRRLDKWDDILSELKKELDAEEDEETESETEDEEESEFEADDSDVASEVTEVAPPTKNNTSKNSWTWPLSLRNCWEFSMSLCGSKRKREEDEQCDKSEESDLRACSSWPGSGAGKPSLTEVRCRKKLRMI